MCFLFGLYTSHTAKWVNEKKKKKSQLPAEGLKFIWATQLRPNQEAQIAQIVAFFKKIVYFRFTVFYQLFKFDPLKSWRMLQLIQFTNAGCY